MAVQAFQPFIGMHLAVKGDLPHWRIPLGSFTGRDRLSERRDHATYQSRYYWCQSIHKMIPLVLWNI
jgi:hypothetical protein